MAPEQVVGGAIEDPDVVRLANFETRSKEAMHAAVSMTNKCDY
jgi:hypothetical protein